MKRVRPGLRARIWAGRRIGVEIGLAVLGCLTGGFWLARGLTVLSASGSVVIASGVALTSAFLGGRRRLLPDSVVEGAESEGPYQVKYCTRASLHEACDLTMDSYGEGYVSHDIAEQWRLKNPNAFVCIYNHDHVMCACFGILALRDEFLIRLIAGDVCDGELGGEDVLEFDQSRQASSLYLSGVVVRGAKSWLGGKRAQLMCWAILEYVRQVYGFRLQRKIYAIAVTEESAQLMEHLGFRIQTGKKRKDNGTLYLLELNEGISDTVLSRIGEWSKSFAGFDLSGTMPKDATHVPYQILFIAGDRGGAQRKTLQTPKEHRELVDAIEGSKFRSRFHVCSPVLCATREDVASMYRHSPAILHFAGHGDDRALNVLVDQGAVVTPTSVSVETLSSVIKQTSGRVRICVFNTCESAPLAEALVQNGVVDAAVGWKGKVSDEDAIAFTRMLYRALGDGLEFSKAAVLGAASCAKEDDVVICGNVRLMDKEE